MGDNRLAKEDTRRIGKLPYKYVICLCILALIGIMVIVFGIYTYYNYQKECQELAGREAVNSSAQVMRQVDERLDNLKQYYITWIEEDECEWILENDLHYSDCIEYMAAAEVMSGKNLFEDYISGYTFVNFRTGWVLSSKGMFPLEEAANGETLKELFERNSGSFDRNYWLYDENGDTADKMSLLYRVTIETRGLSLVMLLPKASLDQYGMFIANINMNTLKDWISQSLSENEEIVVLDSGGELIYATDERLVDSCRQLQGQRLGGRKPQKIEIGGVSSYMVSSKASNVIGWEYYVYSDMKEGRFAAGRMSVSLLVSMFFLVAVCFFVVSYTIYRPVGMLVRNVSDEEQKITGNELVFVADRFMDLKDNKQTLEMVLVQQRDKLQELFELRLLRGEVRSNDEWYEYFQGLHLNPCKYFATAVMTLNLRDEDEAQSNLNEDVICLKLVEELPEDLKKLTWMPIVYNACTIFCLFGSDDEDAMLDQITEFYDGIQRFAEESCGYRILMGVSATHTDYHHIRAAYRESVNALTMETKWRPAEEEGKGAGRQDKDREDCHFFLSSTTVRGNSYNNIYEKDIQTAIKAMDKEQCYKVIDEFCIYLRDISSHEEATVYILRMVNTILLAAISTKLDIDRLYPDGLKRVYYEIMEAIEPSRVRRYLKIVLIDPILEARSELLEDSAHSIMEKIENQIKETRGNISLTECAETLGVHPTYIWKVLKMEEGKSFSEYLEEYRLEEAKRLLQQTNLSVAEIAAELNYSNAQNFIRFFSKGTGVTPGKFRKLY